MYSIISCETIGFNMVKHIMNIIRNNTAKQQGIVLSWYRTKFYGVMCTEIHLQHCVCLILFLVMGRASGTIGDSYLSKKTI
jgi:hypothetical protein